MSTQSISNQATQYTPEDIVMYAEQIVGKDETSVTVDPTLQEGDSGPAVRELQKLLNQKGSNLIVDGVFGRQTKLAVIQFQKANNLNADGIVGRFTWAALRKQTEVPLTLVNVCRYYEPSQFPHQTDAINWLQRQVVYDVFREFTQRWDNIAVSPDFPIKMGDYGAAVYEVQVLLNKLGSQLVTDGDFGSATRRAVMDFQTRSGLIADGIVGYQTWASLRQAAEPRFLRHIFQTYEPTKYPFQTTALEWLQRQITSEVLLQFTQRWRNSVG